MSTSKVYQYNLEGKFIREFASMKEASEQTNTPVSLISRCCSGAREYSKGYTYRKHFVEQISPIETYESEFTGEEFELDFCTPYLNKRARKIMCKLGGLNGDCWEVVSHTQNTEEDPYPRIKFRSKNWKMSRLVYTLYHNKDIADGMFIMHQCDNPRCVNPSHLSEGTPKDNVHDALNKGRMKKPPLHTKLTATEVKAIVASKEKHEVLADLYGVTTTTINDIKSGTTWSKVTGIKNVQEVNDGSILL